jgi:hypothetical protein
MKAHYKQALRDRAETALLNLYHNATPSWPQFTNDKEAEIFWDWLADQASFEIEHLNGGGAYGDNESMKKYFMRKHSSEAASRYAFRRYLRQKGAEQSKYALYERITEYGKLYTWGRGGRTLAPVELIRQRGGSAFSIDTSKAEEANHANLTELVLIVEAFNAYVEAWNKGVPEMFEDWAQDNAELFSDELEEECHV